MVSIFLSPVFSICFNIFISVLDVMCHHICLGLYIWVATLLFDIFVFQLICLGLSVYQPTCLHLSVCQPICLNLSVCLTICHVLFNSLPSVLTLSVCLTICFPHFHLPIYLHCPLCLLNNPLCLTICLALSVCLLIYFTMSFSFPKTSALLSPSD